MSLAPQPGHASRTMAVAVLPLARFLILTFYSTTKVSHQSCFDRSRRTHVIAVLALAVDLRGDRDDLVAVLVGLSTGSEANVEPCALRCLRQSEKGEIKTMRRTRPVRARFSRAPSATVSLLAGAARTVKMRAKRKRTTAKRDMSGE